MRSRYRPLAAALGLVMSVLFAGVCHARGEGRQSTVPSVHNVSGSGPVGAIGSGNRAPGQVICDQSGPVQIHRTAATAPAGNPAPVDTPGQMHTPSYAFLKFGLSVAAVLGGLALRRRLF